MKNTIKILAMSFLVTLLFNCTKKETDSVVPTIQKETLVGRWKDAGIKGKIVIEYQGQKVTEPIDEDANNEVVEFKANGTISNLTALGNGTQFSKYSTKGDQLTLLGTKEGKSFDFIFIYKITGSQLVLSMDKALFVRNVSAMSKAGFSSDFEDFEKYLDAISSIQYDHFLERQ
jgi:hypothetical protein